MSVGITALRAERDPHTAVLLRHFQRGIYVLLPFTLTIVVSTPWSLYYSGEETKNKHIEKLLREQTQNEI